MNLFKHAHSLEYIQEACSRIKRCQCYSQLTDECGDTDQLTPSESAWDNRTCVKKHGKRYPMTNIEAKISRLLLEACEELLPKTSAKNNKKINQALDLVREQLSSRKQS